jgi:histidine ammonia-lyase
MNLDPRASFTLDEVEGLLDSSDKFSLSSSTLKLLEKSHRLVQKLAASDRPIYGVNTGFGKLARIQISKDQIAQMQINFMRSHSCGIGKPLSDRCVRRLLFLRAIGLGKGVSGIAPELLRRHIDYYNRELYPRIPEQGSVGASGDLAPLAHLGLTFIGEGEFMKNGREIPAVKVLRENKWKPLTLGAKEGLALTNGTQFSLALAMELRRELRHLLPWLEWAAILTLEGHRATSAVFAPKIHALKKHRHQQEVAARFFKVLKDSPHMESHVDCDQVQDSYSFRCIPQVFGPAYSILEKADELLEGELNSVSDNPLLFSETEEILPAGHFHAHSVSMACDLIGLAIATLGNISERRVDQIVSPGTTRATPFLTDHPGVESGLMILQTALASLPSENKTLAHPASADTIPTNGNQEDHVSMAPWAARKGLMMLSNLQKIVAAEIITGVRGCVMESTRTGLRFSPALEKLLTQLADATPTLFLSGDRKFGEDWRIVEDYIIRTEAPTL